MKFLKYWGTTLLALLLAGRFATVCLAEDRLTLETQTDTAGDRITVTVQLGDYIDPQDAIRGLQIDVDTSAVDPELLHVEAPRTLIEDETAYTNTSLWSQEENLLRLNYLQFDGTLPAPTRDVLAFELQVDETVAAPGTVTLPMVAKLQMASGLQTTLRTDCTVTYAAQTEGVVSVTITWGALEYTYSDGTWNPETLCYEGGGWSDGDTGFVTVENQGSLGAAAQVVFTPRFPEISGSFYSEEALLQGPLYLARGQSRTARLVLEGKPAQEFQKETLGTVTIRIGEE